MILNKQARQAQKSPLYLIHGEWHKPMLTLFMVLVAIHALEHILQVIQVFALGWPRPMSGGLVGVWMPELARAELLHFAYNLFQLVGLAVLRGGFSGNARRWWTIAVLVQMWHFFEHALLQSQWLMKAYLYGASKPMSLLEVLMPRIELHFIYNILVVTPTLIALFYYFRRSANRRNPNTNTQSR